MYLILFRVGSPSMSSYPAVGLALHQWVLFINDLITALGSDQMTLLWPRGGFHWPERKGKKIMRLWLSSKTLYRRYHLLWPNMNNLLTESSRNQSHDRNTCHSLSGKNLLVCSTCLCMNRYLWEEWASQWHIYLTIFSSPVQSTAMTVFGEKVFYRLYQNLTEAINVYPSSRIHKALLQEVRHISG